MGGEAEKSTKQSYINSTHLLLVEIRDVTSYKKFTKKVRSGGSQPISFFDRILFHVLGHTFLDGQNIHGSSAKR